MSPREPEGGGGRCRLMLGAAAAEALAAAATFASTRKPHSTNTKSLAKRAGPISLAERARCRRHLSVVDVRYQCFAFVVHVARQPASQLLFVFKCVCVKHFI